MLNEKPWSREEIDALAKFFPNKKALNRHIKACAAVHAEQWAETRRPVITLQALPHDFLKAAVYWGCKGTASKRKARRLQRKEVQRQRRQLAASL